MTVLQDYSGPFNPDLTLDDFSRNFLCHLGREYMLLGILVGRTAHPPGAVKDSYARLGIESYMAASPIYSKRMQRLMNFEGDDVGTAFKNMQLDIGAAHQYMDFNFRLDSPNYGEFWVHCGSLLEAELGGPQRVKTMCHDIEDPTFDATAAAINPSMMMRAIHRPPRNSDGNGEGRYPHCRWKVLIADGTNAFEQHPNLAVVQKAKIASIPLVMPKKDREPGGWQDYSGPFEPHAQLEDYSHSALVKLCQEFGAQIQLLVRGYLLSEMNHKGAESAAAMSRSMWIGHACMGAYRLHNFLGIEGDDIQTIAKIVQLHPDFQPRTYLDLRVEVIGDQRARISVNDCPALQEGDSLNWFAQMSYEPHPALNALVRMINPRASCRAVDDPGGARYAWDVMIDPAAEPLAPPAEFEAVKAGRSLAFQFEQRRLLRT
ncbi:hypothetical protein ACG33_03785 [Steroidobacter denitrificans]|uniref:Uncharacterized protein n=1 Tax=Steroidobacter denitrificans TaxID=465721 RepID=A0A127F9K5_STEDE|nr:hypothetical protein [Steroidobacter denitrificans]AMN46239.1 hypothetical protein ACG33_03785 [Steroidobacter denitrificans]